MKIKLKSLREFVEDVNAQSLEDVVAAASPETLRLLDEQIKVAMSVLEKQIKPDNARREKRRAAKAGK